MPRNKIVTLAGEQYSIEQLPMRANKEWRESLSEPINKLVALIQNYRDVEINTAGDAIGLIGVLKDVVLGGVDTIMDMMFAYSPALRADRERIENEAYDDEAMTVFAEVLKLAFPLELLLAAWNGRAETPTLPNSPYTNGNNGTPKRLARQKST